MIEDIDALIEQQDDLEQSISEIKAQLEAAVARQKDTGEYADPVWFAKAKAALRFKGAEHQRLMRRISRRRADTSAMHFRLKHAAMCAANAIHAGTGGLIKGSLLERELRDALGLGPGEFADVTADQVNADQTK